MQKPFGLPTSFIALCEQAKDPQDLLYLLSKEPLEEQVAFFIVAAEDATWLEGGGSSYFSDAFKQFQTMYNKAQLTEELAKVVGKACRDHSTHTLNLCENDFSFRVAGEQVGVSTLLFRCFGGPILGDLVVDYAIHRKREEVSLDNFSKKGFLYIKEFVQEGVMRDLWKEEPELILEVIERANRLQLQKVSQLAFQSYKNYLSKESLLHRFEVALKSHMVDLARELVQIIEQERLGFLLEEIEPGLYELTLERVFEEDEQHLEPLLPWIISLRVERIKEHLSFLSRLFPRWGRLEKVSFREAQELPHPEEFLKMLPSGISVIDGSFARFVDDAFLEELGHLFPSCRSVVLQGCEQITSRGLRSLQTLQELLSLDLSYHPSLDEEFLDVLTLALPNLETLSLAGCQRVDERSLSFIEDRMLELRQLDLSGCKKVTQQVVKRVTGSLPKLTVIYKN